MKKVMLSAVALATTLSPLYANTAAPTSSTPAPPTATAQVNWGSDLSAALAQAKNSGKAVLLVFTGSDWCPPCKMLKQNVFDTPAFADYAQKNFELVEIDIPNGNHISKEQKAANRALAQGMIIRGFPTSLILNQDGAILGGFVGYRDWEEAVELWDADLANKTKIDEAFAAAQQLSGLDKAKALNAINQLCPDERRENNVALIAQILDADPDDALGLRAAAAKEAAENTVAGEVEEIIKSTPQDKMIETIDKLLTRTDLGESLRMTLHWVRFDAMLSDCKTADDLEKIKTAIIAFSKANPSQQPQVDLILEELFSMPADQLLQRIKDR